MSPERRAWPLQSLASTLRLWPSSLFRTRSDAPFLSTTRLLVFTQRRSSNLLMTRHPTSGALGTSSTSTSSTGSSSHVLHARQSEQESTSGQSLTFGFAFMAILLSLLFFAHLMQRAANRRQRDVLERMTALQEAREREEVPKLWDVHLRRVRSGSGSSGSTDGRRTGAGAGAGGKEKEESRDAMGSTSGKLRWKDIQPLSARTISSTSTSTPISTTGTPTEAGHDRYDRPLRVAVLIAMPGPGPGPGPGPPGSPISMAMSKTSGNNRSPRRDSGKGFTDAPPAELNSDSGCTDTDTDRRFLPYYELGVAIVK